MLATIRVIGALVVFLVVLAGLSVSGYPAAVAWLIGTGLVFGALMIFEAPCLIRAKLLGSRWKTTRTETSWDLSDFLNRVGHSGETVGQQMEDHAYCITKTSWDLSDFLNRVGSHVMAGVSIGVASLTATLVTIGAVMLFAIGSWIGRHLFANRLKTLWRISLFSAIPVLVAVFISLSIVSIDRPVYLFPLSRLSGARGYPRANIRSCGN